MRIKMVAGETLGYRIELVFPETPAARLQASYNKLAASLHGYGLSCASLGRERITFLLHSLSHTKYRAVG